MENATESKIKHKGYFSFPMRMMDCAKQTQRKLDQLRVKYRTIESSRSTSAPRTNSSRKLSKTLRKRSKSSSKLSRTSFSRSSKLAKTQSILKNSRYAKRNLKLSLTSTPSVVSPKRSESTLRNQVIVTSPRLESPVFYPSLSRPSRRNKANTDLPIEIQERNKILFSLRSEATTRGFVAEPEEPPDEQDVVRRSLNWLVKKKKKIEKSRASLVQLAQSKCTFKPYIYKRKVEQDFKTLTTKASDSLDPEDCLSKVKSIQKVKSIKSVKFVKKTLKLNKPNSSLQSSPRRFINENPYFPLSPYNNITPTRLPLAYKHGFSQQLLKISRPMLDYTKLMYKNT